MARVQMLHHITGGRGDGSPWPHAGDVLVCGEQEARDLVAGGNARWTDIPAPAVPDEPERPADTPETVTGDDGTPEPEDGSQDDAPDEDVNRPGVRAPKQDWVDYASRYRGCHPARAAEMTKADLIAEYGRQNT